ncbi:MAG: hypothetical protein R2838_20825 [Caldilineaceae bacterium]
MAAIDTPFDTVAHTLEVRRIEPGRGVHNIPNVGIFLWRIQAYALQDSPAARLDARRYRFDPLGRDMLLFNDPVPETTITHLAERTNVPMPLGRRELNDHLAQFYGADASLLVKTADGTPVPRDRVRAVTSPTPPAVTGPTCPRRPRPVIRLSSPSTRCWDAWRSVRT